MLRLFGLQYLKLWYLSMYVFFMLSRDTSDEVYLMLVYFDIQLILQFIMFHY